MADKIKVNEDEYNDLKSKLDDIHEDILQQMESVLVSINSLNSSTGEFYTEKVSPKVELICSELRTVKGTLEELYSASAATTESFKTAVGDLDSCN